MSDDADSDNLPRRPLHFIPFGRFRVDRDISGDSTSVLVGRERQRAFLVDALTGAPKRGAYLVTGRRGVGKTTFVHSCISEFEANIYRRHLRSIAGRSPLDMIFTFVIIFGWILLSLTASDLVEFIASLESLNALLFLLLIIAALIVATPILYGWHIISILAKSLSTTWFSVVRFFLFAMAVCLAYAVLPFGSPAYSILASIVAFIVLVTFSFACCTRRAPLIPYFNYQKNGLSLEGYFYSIWACRVLSVFLLPLAVTAVILYFFKQNIVFSTIGSTFA
ncbi:MAG: ATP-binding protein, partial [Pseudomonadota bacterium]